jgi:S-adenosylmethionine decarboxylase
MSTQQSPLTTSLSNVMATNGMHVLYDMYGCDAAKLNDLDYLVDLIVSSANTTGATVLGKLSHKFEPQGVTAIALLAESHISIHTWPELGYAAVDVLTCGENMDPQKCMDLIADALQPTESVEKLIERKIR